MSDFSFLRRGFVAFGVITWGVAGCAGDAATGANDELGMESRALGANCTQGGCVLSAQGWGDFANDGASAVTVDAAGNAIVVSTEYSVSDQHWRAFVRRLGDAGGGTTWGRMVGDADGNAGISAVRTDAAGNVYVTGYVSSRADDVVLAKFAPDGTRVWEKRFGSATEDRATAIHVDATGVTIAGRHGAGANFGGLPFTSEGLFIARYNAKGAHQWSKSFPASNTSLPLMAVDAQGRIFLTGSFDDTIDFGGGPLQSARFSDVFLVALGADRKHLWSKRMGGDSFDSVGDIALDPNGDIVLTGDFSGNADFGGGPFSAGEYDQFFIAKYDQNGQPIWAKQSTGAQSHFSHGAAGSALAIDGSGSIVVTGNFGSRWDIGGCPALSGDVADIFVTKLSPAGACTWSKRFGSPSTPPQRASESGNGVAFAPNGDILLVGSAGEYASFDDITLTGHGVNADAFVARLRR